MKFSDIFRLQGIIDMGKWGSNGPEQQDAKSFMTLKIQIEVVIDTTSKERVEQEIKDFFEGELFVDLDNDFKMVVEEK